MQKRRLRQSLLAISLAIALAACGTSTQTLPPSPTPSAIPTPTLAPAQTAAPTPTQGDSAETSPRPSADAAADQAVYTRIEAQVEGVRDLAHKSPVKPVLLDLAGLRDWLVKANASETDHAAVANEGKILVHLGLLPAGSDLEKMMLDLQAGQVVGFYDPVSKGLYVLSDSGGVGPTQQITFAHEYTHALQDQVFGLDKLAIDATDQSDRDLARTALVEGDATESMTLWATANMSILDLLGVAGDSSSAAQTEQLAGAPAILRESLLFPYEDGLSFVQAIYKEGGWAAVDRLYANPPSSTSQILHPNLYAENVKPVAVSVPPVPAALDGWKLSTQDTLGELQLRVWLAGEQPSDAAGTAAATAVSAWAGDRVGLYEGPNGAWAVVLETSWRTQAGALAFESAARATLESLASPSHVSNGPGGVVSITIASDQSIVAKFGSGG